MTFHRYLYKLCWRTRLLIPVVLITVVIAAGLYLHPASHLDKHHPHRLFPRFQHPLDKANIDNEGPANPRPIREEDLKFVPLDPITQKPLSYINANLQNAALFKANSSNPASRDPLVVTPQLTRIFVPRIKKDDKTQTNKKIRKKVKVSPQRSAHLFRNNKNTPEEFDMWQLSRTSFCEGNLDAYQNEFTHMRNVIIEKKNCVSERKGGEFLEDVVNQEEELEYYEYLPGCFQVLCSERPVYYFNNKNHLNDYVLALKTRKIDTSSVTDVSSNFTIVVTRYEYANIYHTMTDWYNAFVLMEFFNKTQQETNILIVDTHPRGVLDPVWPVLFNSVKRLSHLSEKTLFKDMAWGIIGYNSPLLVHYQQSVPLVEEFRSFFLKSFFVSPTKHQLQCDKLNIMFVWRRDYVAHPRNPAGQVSRKVRNEKELMAAIQYRYPKFNVRGVQIDLFDMQQQLKLISTTDILIGMHGAGLTHILFLPQKAAVIELVPNYWSSSSDHFLSLATWRKLHYQRWINEDPRNEIANFYTRIPPIVVGALIQRAMTDICSKEKPATSGSMIHPLVSVNDNGEVRDVYEEAFYQENYDRDSNANGSLDDKSPSSQANNTGTVKRTAGHTSFSNRTTFSPSNQ